MRKERLANVLDKTVTAVIIVGVCAAVGYGKWVTTTHTTDLKHQVTELDLRLQEQNTGQTEMQKGLQTQIESATVQNAELQKTNNDLLWENNTLKEQLAKKNKPVRIASASRDGSIGALTGFEVTWYNNDGLSGITRSGKPTQDGVTVSADTRILPLGTRIKIIMPDGTELLREVQDTGSAVKGRILDVYASASRAELMRRGRTHNVTVEVLGGD